MFIVIYYSNLYISNFLDKMCVHSYHNMGVIHKYLQDKFMGQEDEKKENITYQTAVKDIEDWGKTQTTKKNIIQN